MKKKFVTGVLSIFVFCSVVMGCATATTGTNENKADFYFDRGQRYMEKGDLDRAIADFTEVIRLAPDAFNAYILRSSIYYKKEDFDRAIADYTQIIRLTPLVTDDAKYVQAYLYNFYCLRGEAHLGILNRIHQSEEAQESKEARKAREIDLAIVDFTEAIKLNNTDKRAYIGRGTAYMTMQDVDRSIADFEKVIELDPKNVMAIDALVALKFNLLMGGN